MCFLSGIGGMPCFDGLHCVDFSKPESTVGAFVVVVGDFVAVRARTS
jgi:hypothetical protein